MTLVALNDTVTTIQGRCLLKVWHLTKYGSLQYFCILRNNHLPKITWLTEHSKIFWDAIVMHDNAGRLSHWRQVCIATMSYYGGWYGLLPYSGLISRGEIFVD